MEGLPLAKCDHLSKNRKTLLHEIGAHEAMLTQGSKTQTERRRGFSYRVCSVQLKEVEVTVVTSRPGSVK